MRLTFAKTLFLKTDLPIIFLRYKWTKISNLSVVVNRYIVCTGLGIWWIYKYKSVQSVHTTCRNFNI